MRYILLFSFFLFLSCNFSNKKLTSQQIVDATMRVSGTNLLDNATISFYFRNKKYQSMRSKGKFSLDRTTIVDSVFITDVVSNNGFQRFVNNKKIKVLDSMAVQYASAVNSVHYFSVLPFGLNDNAVIKKRLPEVSINGKEYYKIEISFSKEDGGEDFEDVFIYWIDKKSFFIDYLAYAFHVNGGGVRFREAKDQHMNKGIRFADYNNYKSSNKKPVLANLDKEYQEHSLVKVSEILLKDVQVQLNNN